jgi:hypothetical protein
MNFGPTNNNDLHHNCQVCDSSLERPSADSRSSSPAYAAFAARASCSGLHRNVGSPPIARSEILNARPLIPSEGAPQSNAFNDGLIFSLAFSLGYCFQFFHQVIWQPDGVRECAIPLRRRRWAKAGSCCFCSRVRQDFNLFADSALKFGLRNF